MAYSYSTVQFTLPDDKADVVKQLARSVIKDSDVIKFENIPHVTVQYGLSDPDPDTVAAALRKQKCCVITLGDVDYFPDRGDGDVVYVTVQDGGLSRLRGVVRDNAAFVDKHGTYRPHITLAYVKPGEGSKYKGRSELNGTQIDVDKLVFSTPDGVKTDVELVKESAFPSNALEYPAANMAVGGAVGGLAGRYVAAPLIAKLLNLDPARLRNTLMLLGAAAGASPGLMLGLRNSKLHGNFNAAGHLPTDKGRLSWLSKALPRANKPLPPDKQPVPWSAIVKSNNAATYQEALWRPSFPVAQAIDDIRRNPYPNIAERVKMTQLIAQAGNEQGVGLTGMASPGALLNALPDVVGYAVPNVLGAYVVSNLLGAPSWAKNTATGAALTYSALKGFLSKSGEDTSVIDKKEAFKSAFLTCMAEAGVLPEDMERYMDKKAFGPLAGAGPAVAKGGLTLAAILSRLGPVPLTILATAPFAAGSVLGQVARSGYEADEDTLKDVRDRELTNKYRQMAYTIRRRLADPEAE